MKLNAPATQCPGVPLAEASKPPVESNASATSVRTVRFGNMDDNKSPIPPAVFSADPEQELEEKLRNSPDDQNAKADVGSDESMDASDPPAAAQPGSSEPAPSSGFPKHN